MDVRNKDAFLAKWSNELYYVSDHLKLLLTYIRGDQFLLIHKDQVKQGGSLLKILVVGVHF